MIEIAQNKFNETEVSAFITVFMMRSITLEEMQGFREALLDLAVKVDFRNARFGRYCQELAAMEKTPSTFQLWQVLLWPKTRTKSGETRQLRCFCDFRFV